VKALVAYSSNTGVTAEIAERIGEVLTSEGVTVVLSDLKREKPNPEGYDLVLVGSGIKMGQWIKGSTRFLEANLQALSGKTAFFVSCGDASVPEKRAEAQTKYLDTVAEIYGIEPVSTGLFEGCYKWNKYNFFVKQLVKGILKEQGVIGVNTGEPLDYRDWSRIELWAKELTGKVN
jgi:menaquinone-dependent protoporphyrinogen oxidase